MATATKILRHEHEAILNGFQLSVLADVKTAEGENFVELMPSPHLGHPCRQVKGNLRFPLTCTYHGCPRAHTVGENRKMGTRLKALPG